MTDDFGLLPQPAYNKESMYYGNIYFYPPKLGVPATLYESRIKSVDRAIETFIASFSD